MKRFIFGVLALLGTLQLSIIAYASGSVEIDYAYVSSYDPVVRGNYCVTQ